MKINTGRGTIPLITLVGIWSVSALTSLPGLAVSPILGQRLFVSLNKWMHFVQIPRPEFPTQEIN